MTPSAIGEDVAEALGADAGVREDRHVGHGILRGLQVTHREGDARCRTGDEDRVDAEKRRAAGAIRDAAAADRAAELGRDVVEERDVVGADRGAVAGEIADRRCDHAEVALVHAGEHLTDEGRAGRSRDGDARLRIPEDVDAERHAHRRAKLADDGRHRRRNLRPDHELIGDVVLVAEEHTVDAGTLQRLEVAADHVDEVAPAELTIVAGPAGQAREMQHRDHRLRGAESLRAATGSSHLLSAPRRGADQ